jgi:hypothetical protein
MLFFAPVQDCSWTENLRASILQYLSLAGYCSGSTTGALLEKTTAAKTHQGRLAVTQDQIFSLRTRALLGLEL